MTSYGYKCNAALFQAQVLDATLLVFSAGDVDLQIALKVA
jgi:hypothetical protein